MDKYYIDDTVLVLWDDGTWTVGVVLDSYRGHRNQVYVVRMTDGEVEKVYNYQIALGVC